MSGLAIVVPAYNEAASIRRLVESLVGQAEHIIVVDDGSTDGTADAVSDLAVTLLRNERNRGKGAALARGIRAAAADETVDRVATVDADGQHDPTQLTPLATASLAHPRALILGARTGKSQRAPRARRLANGIADFFIAWAARQPVADTQTGLRVYPLDRLVALMDRGRLRSTGFGWEAEALIELARAGTPIVQVEVPAIYNHTGSPSHYRPALDSAIMTLLVGRRLLARGLDPIGLIRSRRKGR